MIVSTKPQKCNTPVNVEIPKHMPASRTYSSKTDTLVLYEPCLRPSIVDRTGRSSSLGRYCQSNCVARESKSVQTDEQDCAIYTATPTPKGQLQATPSEQSAVTTRSPESHESARNPSPFSLADSTSLRREVTRRQTLGGSVGRTSGIPRQMPTLNWSSSVRHLGEEQRLRQTIRKRALFVLDIDLVAVLSMIIVCALFIAITSITQQIFWPSSSSCSDDSHVIPVDRSYLHQDVYY